MDSTNLDGLNEEDLKEISESIDRAMKDNPKTIKNEDDELDFASIQRIFAQRDCELKEKEELEIINKGNKAKQQDSSTSIEVKTSEEIISIHEYDNMHVKNIKATSKSKKHLQKATAVLVVGAIIIGGIIVWGNNQNTKTKEKDTTSFSDKNFATETINPEECDLSNFIIIIKESTENVNALSRVISIELNTLGIENNTVKSTENLVEKIREIKSKDEEKEIIVINIDGEINKSATETIVITNYANGAKSADTLALAIHNSNEEIYEITSDIKCGKKDTSNGYRERTSAEEELYKAGIISIPTLTIAPNRSFLTDDINTNNLATSIVEGIIRIAALEEEKRYEDIIRRVDYGDTISEIAEKNNVSESFIISQNSEVLSNTSGILKNDTALIVKGIPKELTSAMVVKNKAITTNPDDIKTILSYYVVEENDTVSEIAEKLNISQNDFIIPSGDVDVINVGDKIGYETTSGPILVTKSNINTK